MVRNLHRSQPKSNRDTPWAGGTYLSTVEKSIFCFESSHWPAGHRCITVNSPDRPLFDQDRHIHENIHGTNGTETHSQFVDIVDTRDAITVKMNGDVNEYEFSGNFLTDSATGLRRHG